MAHQVLSGASVNQWNASYYDDSNKRWIYGTLHLLPTALFFEAKNLESKNNPDNPLELFVKFSVISAIRKASSSFIYPSITFSTTSNVTHWFSSFSNRDSTFFVIQHFFHSFLLTTNSKEAEDGQNFTKTMPSNKSSKLGRELLQSVNDSHETLVSAASRLTTQGHQLANASCIMDDMNEDLNVATRVTNGIDSWFGRWKVPKAYKQENMLVVNDKDIPYGFHFDGICSEIQGMKYGLPKECVLRLVKDGLTILNSHQKILHHFRWSDVSRVQVVSSWELIISQFFIGKPDIAYTITAVEMPRVLKELEKLIPKKMEYMNPSSAISSHEKENRNRGQPFAVSDMTTKERHYEQTSFSPDECGDDLQRQQMDDEGMTEEEVNQLSKTLSNLKSLALNVQTEEDKHIKALDGLIDSVDKGNDKLRHLNKKINKMI